MASDFLSNYIFLTVGRVGSSHVLITQAIEYLQSYEDKKSMLMDLVHMVQGLTLVFMAGPGHAPLTRPGTARVSHSLFA